MRRWNRRRWVGWGAAVALSATLGCGQEQATATADGAAEDAGAEVTPVSTREAASADAPDAAAQALLARARPLFGELPEVVDNPANPVTEEKVELGRLLYYETRLSQAEDISCNSCHDLASYGVDVREVSGRTSAGHEGALGDRNSPTVYNAALHVAQFWDGRAADVEEQAKGPILNPVEMAMPAADEVEERLRNIDGYAPLFAAAFPDDADPIDYDNMARAIAAFERRLLTPSRFDAFLAGDTEALDAQEQRGLGLFLDVGCVTCHAGPAVGGQMFQKLGLLKPYPTEDTGRARVTENEADAYVFKVPSLRNIAETGPYLHDGSIDTLEEMVRIMAEYQTPKGSLTDEETADLVAFLRALTGPLPTEYIAEPEPVPSGRAPGDSEADPS